VCVCVCVCACVSVCVSVTHTERHIYIHVYIYTCIYIGERNATRNGTEAGEGSAGADDKDKAQACLYVCMSVRVMRLVHVYTDRPQGEGAGKCVCLSLRRGYVSVCLYVCLSVCL